MVVLFYCVNYRAEVFISQHYINIMFTKALWFLVIQAGLVKLGLGPIPVKCLCGLSRFTIGADN